jgi:hypothetical protein
MTISHFGRHLFDKKDQMKLDTLDCKQPIVKSKYVLESEGLLHGEWSWEISVNIMGRLQARRLENQILIFRQRAEIYLFSDFKPSVGPLPGFPPSG